MTLLTRAFALLKKAQLRIGNSLKVGNRNLNSRGQLNAHIATSTARDRFHRAQRYASLSYWPAHLQSSGGLALRPDLPREPSPCRFPRPGSREILLRL